MAKVGSVTEATPIWNLRMMSGSTICAEYLPTFFDTCWYMIWKSSPAKIFAIGPSRPIRRA